MACMNKLTSGKRAAVVAALVEGMSIRSTVRMTGVAKNTVTKLLVDLGCVCGRYQHRVLRNLPCRRVQVDEIWSFCYAKAKNVPADKRGEFGYGDVWTWTAIDAETKLVPSFLIGDRTAESARFFIDDLASRMARRIQLTSDGHRAYLTAVDEAFGGDVDYAMLVKLYGNEGGHGPERKYSPNECVGCRKTPVSGDPDPEHVSTSFAERQNLTMRMAMRRFTRLTNAFSKKIDNLGHAVSVHYLHYNFVRKHQTLKTTPAVAAGVADRVWTIADMIGLLEADESISD